MTVEFWLTTLVIVVTPGTGVVYTMASALSRGARAGVVASFACTLGILPHMAAAITGLAALLHTSALAFEILKYAGVAYLLYMAVATWRDRSALVVDEAEPRSTGRVILSGVLLNVLNPKLTIFFFAFLPQFVGAGQPNASATMILMSLVFMALTFVVFVGYGMFAAAIRHHVVSRPSLVTWIRRTFAAAFVAFGAKLALTGP